MTEPQQAEHRLSKLVKDMSGSIHAEMRKGFRRVEAATRRNTTMLTAGAPAIAALKRWAGQRDVADRKREPLFTTWTAASARWNAR